MLRVVRLTFSTKSTPFLLVISEAHVILATFWVVVWASGPIVDSATTNLMGAFANFEVITNLIDLIFRHSCETSRKHI